MTTRKARRTIICKNCRFWRAHGQLGFGNCQELRNGVHIRISGTRLQTNEFFSCRYFKKIVENHTENQENGNSDNSIEN